MAKRKTQTIPEYIDHMEQEGLLEQENVSKEVLDDSYIQLLDVEDKLRERVFILRDKGFDINNISATLMLPKHKVEQILK